MSLENEARSSPEKHAEILCDLQTHSKISYTRDFLLSLSELDICKRLPSGFEQSILSEFEDAFHGIQDRQRIGNPPLQSFRRGEYGSSPPSKGDSSNHSRGIYGRWESRSSGRDDRDIDSQSDWGSESGRRYGNQSRRPWQSSEHDGLLGSGSFPKSSGFAPGMPIPKARANDHYQLNKSNELYHPPRPYKAVPHTRRDTHDSVNDETFGSSESTSEDRANEERKRRASFELMRKEQHKALQEKQKLNSDKNRNDNVSDNAAFLDDAKDGKRPLDRSNELDDSVILEVSNNDVGKSSSPSQASGYRPLVPPGFRSTVLEKNSGTKSSIHSHLTEIVKSENEGSLFQPRVNSAQNGALGSKEERQSVEGTDLSGRQLEGTNIHARIFDKGEKVVNSSSALEMSFDKGLNNQLRQASSLSESQGTLDSGETNLDTEEVRVHKIIGESNRDHSTSILQKLFGSALTENTGGSSVLIEARDSKPDDKCSPYTAQSSKFAQWFLDEEKKSGDELVASTRPSDLLSLIGGGEKGGLQVSDVQAAEHLISPHTSFQSSQHVNRHMTSDITCAASGISDQLYARDKKDVGPTVLTCEHLEQTILSELSESYSTVQGGSLSGAKIEQPKAEIDNRASQHLLSLLHKGTGLITEMATPSNPNIISSDKPHVSEVTNVGHTADSLIEANVTNIQNPDKNLTLETLFGTAFMKELQSVDAPVSVQRGSVGSTRIDIPVPHDSFRVMDKHLFPSSIGEVESSRKSADGYVLASNPGQQTELDKIERLFGYNEPPQREMVDSSKHQSGGFDGTVDIQFPEEESLISVGGGPVKIPSSMFMTASGNSTKGGGFLTTSNSPDQIAEKLAALNNNTVFKNEQSMIGPHNQMSCEIPYRNPLAQQQSSQFRAAQLNHGRPLFHPSLDSHHPAQMKFMAPDSIMRHDATTPNHQFPAVLRPPFHRPNSVLSEFDIHGGHHQHPILQQMQMAAGNFPSPHPLQEFYKGAPVPRPGTQPTGFIHELNQMQGFPLNQRQPNIGGIGMRMSGADDNNGSGSNHHHPDVLKRLIEMEMRAKSKQQQQQQQQQQIHHLHHPYAAGHNQGQQGMYGNEGGDMGGGGFHYR